MIGGFETIILEKDRGVAHLALNRPQVLNAFNTTMRDEMWQALEMIRCDPEVGVVLLRGEGERAFCAGADLSEFGTAPSQVIARQVRFERGVWELWLSIPKPFVCALQGYVLGSGIEMALLCDLRIADEDALFGMPEVALGMIPAAGGTQTLTHTVGIPQALGLLLTNRRVNAGEALSLGLVNRVVHRDRLLVEAEFIARSLLSRGPLALRLLKEAVLRGMELPLPQALELESTLALQSFLSSAHSDVSK